MAPLLADTTHWIILWVGIINGEMAQERQEEIFWEARKILR